MRQVVVTFDMYTYPQTKNLPCPSCGKKVRRQKTFTGTCNPYSNPPNMTYQQMRERLRPEMDRWLAEPAICTSCRRDGR